MFHRDVSIQMTEILDTVDRNRRKIAKAVEEGEISLFTPKNEYSISPIPEINQRQKSKMNDAHQYEVCEILARQKNLHVKKTKAGKISVYLIDPGMQRQGKKQFQEYLCSCTSVHELYEMLIS